MSCLPDLVSLIAHGANGTCGPPGAASWVSALWLSAATLALLVALRWRRRLVVPVVVALAVPGSWLALQRADGPRSVARSAAAVQAFMVAARAFARRNDGCIDVDASRCEVCDPIARYAAAPTRPCARPAVLAPTLEALAGPAP